MMKLLVIILTGFLLLSFAPEGLCHGCENSPPFKAALPFWYHHHNNISVTYTVADDVNHSFRHSICVTVPKNSFFFNVMKSAQMQDSAKFSFRYTVSVWGAYITTVNDLEADDKQRTYWQLLSNGIPLKLGAGCYAVSPGEKLEVRFTTY